MYYANKIETLKDLFGAERVRVEDTRIFIDEREYPIIDDVIVFLSPEQYPKALRQRIPLQKKMNEVNKSEFAEDIQFTFGEEWKNHPDVLPEHTDEYRQYFDLVDHQVLKGARVCDLGCGVGRWSSYASKMCKEIVLVDFSEAIFVARKNLKDTKHAIFIMADIRALPFRADCFDFLFCLGVLHHLPTNALGEVRNLKKYSPRTLIYLYYSLDNRPAYFRTLLTFVTGLRLVVSRVRSPLFRSLFTTFAAYAFYAPFILAGQAAKSMRIKQSLPLCEAYQGKSMKRIKQDVYDRFFTRIEQRFSRKEIMGLLDTYGKISISEGLPYWHFLCER